MSYKLEQMFEGVPLRVNPLELIQGAKNVGKGLQIMNKTAKTLDRTYTWFVEPAPKHQKALKIAIAVLSATTLVVSISFASPYIFAMGNVAGASLLILKVIDQYQERTQPLQEARPNPPEAREESKREPEAKAATHVDQSQEWAKEFINAQREDWGQEFHEMHQTQAPVTTDFDEALQSALEDFEQAEKASNSVPLPATATTLQGEMQHVSDRVSVRKNLPSTLESWVDEFERAAATPVAAVPATAAAATVGAAATVATVETAATTAASLGNVSVATDVASFLIEETGETWVNQFEILQWVSEFVS